MNYSENDFQIFYKQGKKQDNYEVNKKREIIINDIIKNKVPSSYLKKSYYWVEIINNLRMCIEENIGNPYQLKIKHKGGMSNNYDFLVKNESHKKMKLEFKYKSTGNIKNFCIASKHDISKFFNDNSYEDFFYSNYVPKMCDFLNIPIIEKEEYLKNVVPPSPKIPSCFFFSTVENCYYRGCKTSRRFSKDHKDIEFYNLCSRLCKESIKTFIFKNNLNLEEISKYLISTDQHKKHFLFCQK